MAPEAGAQAGLKGARRGGEDPRTAQQPFTERSGLSSHTAIGGPQTSSTTSSSGKRTLGAPAARSLGSRYPAVAITAAV